MKKINVVFLFIAISLISFAQEENPLPCVLKEPAYDIAPSFPGGLEAINKFFIDSIRYPEPEKSKRIQGSVYVKFKVTKKGSIKDIVAINGVPGGPNLVKESVRLLNSMPRWIPATKNNKKVEAEYYMSIPFKLPNQN